MKLLNYITIALLTGSLSSFSVYAQTTFQATYGGHSNSNTIIQTLDGGYFIAGWSDSLGLGAELMYLIKTDAGGDTTWGKQYFNITGAMAGKQTLDGGYILAGVSNLGEDGMTAKVDSLGEIQWVKGYGGPYLDMCYDVLQNADSTYMTAGTVGDAWPSGEKVLLIKTDTNGDTLWTKTYEGVLGLHGWPWSIDHTAVGGYVMAGTTFTSSSGSEDASVINTDINGTPIWANTYGGPGVDAFMSAIQTSDGGFIMLGSTESYGTGPCDILVVKTDVFGNTLWAKAYGGSGYDEGRDIVQTTDGGYAITGVLRTNSEQTCLIKIDSLGNIIWNTAFQDNVPNESYSIVQTNDDGYAISGWTDTPSSQMLFVIKSDATGNGGGCDQSTPSLITTNVTMPAVSQSLIVESGITVTTPTFSIINKGETVDTTCQVLSSASYFIEAIDIEVFPNPFNQSATLEFSNPDEVEHQITISDISGKMVQQISNVTANTVQLNCSGLTTGFYMVLIENETGLIGSKKIIIK